MDEMQEFQSGSTKGFLHLPRKPESNIGLILTHGAGGNCRSALLVAVAEHFARARVWVLRYDLPFRQSRPFGPPTGKSEKDREGLQAAARALSTTGPKSIFLGGHSYGGRQASILAVEDSDLCDGLLLLSYPLHPPKQPRKLRTEHFGRLQSKALFVHGIKDPFGSEDELRGAIDQIPAETSVVLIGNAGHDLLRGNFNVGEQVVTPFFKLMNREIGPD